MSHGVGTMALNSASPMLVAAAAASSQHSLANEMTSALLARPDATLSSDASSAVTSPHAIPWLMFLTSEPDVCTTISVGVRMPGTGLLWN